MLTALQFFQNYMPLISPPRSSDNFAAVTSAFAARGFDFRHYDSYLYEQSKLVLAYQAMLAEIERCGARILLSAHVSNITRDADTFRVVASDHGGMLEVLTPRVVLAVGRFGNELLQQLDAQWSLGGRVGPCDIGVRLEMPVWAWPDIDTHHNDLKLHFGDARTFCVCKDGTLAPYRVADCFLAEGHADPATRTGFTNFAVVVRSSGGNRDHRTLFAAILASQRQRTGGLPIRQRLTEYLSGSDCVHVSPMPASISFWRWGTVSDCYPREISDNVREAVRSLTSALLPLEAHEHVAVFAPEVDYFWLRFPVGEGFASRVPGAFLVGDCAGQFRGILQAFASGLVCARHIAGGHDVP